MPLQVCTESCHGDPGACHYIDISVRDFAANADDKKLQALWKHTTAQSCMDESPVVPPKTQAHFDAVHGYVS